VVLMDEEPGTLGVVRGCSVSNSVCQVGLGMEQCTGRRLLQARKAAGGGGARIARAGELSAREEKQKQ